MSKVFSKISLLFILLLLLSFQISITQTQAQSLKAQRLGEDQGGFKNFKISPEYGKIPLYFIPNEGQVNEQALFYATASRYTLWITKEGLVFDSSRRIEEKGLKNQIMSLRDEIGPEDQKYDRDVSKLLFLKSSKNTEIVPVDITEHRVNYFLGNDKSKWRTNIQGSRGVLYKELYRNIDLKVYGAEKQIEYDFIVKPGGKVTDISFEYRDVEKTKIDSGGNLVIETKFGELKHSKPVCYQIIEGEKFEVEAQFKETRKNTYGFKVEEYNKDYDLIIDPMVFVYSSYLGGSNFESGYGIAVDSEGAAYVTGATYSTDFPTQNPIQGSNAGAYDIFILKVNPTGTALVYSTYLGGSNFESGYGIAVDSEGAAYVTGSTKSTDFPTQNPIQGSKAGNWDVFITKISSSGSALSYSTYLGGSDYDYGRSLAVDSEGAAYVTGYTKSTDFPTQNPIQGSNAGNDDAFVTKINSLGSILVYSTYLGGSDWDTAGGIAAGSDGAAYVTGDTYSIFDFPLQSPVKGSYTGMGDAFVTKINSAGTALVYSTYLGVCEDWDIGLGIAVDSEGAAYVTGLYETGDWWWGDPRGVFVIKINSSGSAFVYSKYLGKYKSYDYGEGIAVDSDGAAYVIGTTWFDFFSGDPIAGNDEADCDVLILKINPTGSEITYNTYFGGSDYDKGYGIAVDLKGRAYVTGGTQSTDFPTQNPVQGDNAGGVDVFIAKLCFFTHSLTLIAGKGGATNPEAGTYDYCDGTEVTIQAIPNEGYGFSQWVGDVPYGKENENPITITMDSDRWIKAKFILGYTLTISSGPGGTTNPPPGAYAYPSGTEVTITAIPDTHYRLSEWTGDVPSGKESNNPITITMNSDKSIKANFCRIIYPPLNAAGQKVLNRSLSQVEYINVLTWEAHPDNVNITKYRIYQVEGESRSLLVELNADTFKYWHRDVEKDRQYAYVLVAVNDEGREGDSAYITVQ